MALLPSPDEIAEDLGVLEPDPDLVPDEPPAPVEDELPGPEPIPLPSGPDEPPGHVKERKKRGRPPGSSSAPSKPPRVTQAVRGDIDAKLRFMLTLPGQVWAARDPICGGTFIQQVPDVAEALTDIVCDSADLLTFFSGTGGNFMKALKLGVAVMPVVSMVAAHHVYHSIEDVPQQDLQQPEQQYAA